MQACNQSDPSDATADIAAAGRSDVDAGPAAGDAAPAGDAARATACQAPALGALQTNNALLLVGNPIGTGESVVGFLRKQVPVRVNVAPPELVFGAQAWLVSP